MMTITGALLAEHTVFHSLFDQIERMAPRLKTAAEVRAIARLLASVMEAHSHTEDALFIEPLEHCLQQLGQHDTFHEEHKQIDANLKLAQTARSAKGARQALLASVLAARRHFDKEERVLFPLAEKVLKKKSLTELGKAWGHRREEHAAQLLRLSASS
jgi:hemerythrin-like domain-containing protein